MAKINLSRIHFRPYQEGDIPTEYGFDDHTSTPGAIDLSNIQFRTWEDNGHTSLGGSGFNDPQPPGGGGAGPDPGGIELGEYAVFFNGLTTDAAAWKTFTGVTLIYARVAVYVSSAQMASWLPGSQFGGDFLELSTDSDPLFSVQGLFFTNRNAANVVDGNMYVRDFENPQSAAKLVTPDTWHIGEIAIRTNATHYQGNFRWDGVEGAWGNIGTLASIPGGITTMVIGNQFNDSNAYWYLDNAMYSLTDWISSGGSVVFQDGFESQDFSQWTGTYGTIQIGSQP